MAAIYTAPAGTAPRVGPQRAAAGRSGPRNAARSQPTRAMGRVRLIVVHSHLARLVRAATVIVLAVAPGGCGRLGFEITGGGASDPDGGPDPAVDAAGDAPVSPLTARALATGREHTCAIRAGRLACWGQGVSGQLGLGDVQSRLAPVEVEASERWLDVAAGGDHTCAVRADRTLWCWGLNRFGELGIGSMAAQVATPTAVTLPGPVASVVSGFSTTCARLDDGSLWCWGWNAEGQAAQGGAIDDPEVRAPARVGADVGWTAIAAGQGHTLGVRAGALLGSGRNDNSELGLGPGMPGQVRVLTPIDAGPWKLVTAGQNGSGGLTADGRAFTWGANVGASLGQPTLVNYDQPTLLDDTESWSTIDLDTFHGCGIVASGAMRCWGRNVEGQLGRGDNADAMGPAPSGADTDWVSVDVARFHTCAQRASGSVWCTGDNGSAQLGTGDTDRRNAWTEVALP